MAEDRATPADGVQAGPLHRRRAGVRVPRARSGQVAWLLLYPDTYEIGLPNQGLQILYEILNERPDALAERAYAPWVDMEAAMRAAGVPAVQRRAAPARRRLRCPGVQPVGRARLHQRPQPDRPGRPPAVAAERRGRHAFVLAGGHCAFNPEPLADFVDAFVLGDGEEAVGEVNEVLAAWIGSAPPTERDRGDVLASLARLEGVYVPALYRPTYENGRLVSTLPAAPGVPAEVAKRTVSDLADWPYPSRPLVPLTEVVHDRLNVEVFRGCTRGCRFCQAGMITRPVRERPAAQVRELVRDGLEWSGHDEVTLTSLSTADFSDIEDLVRDIVDDPSTAGTCRSACRRCASTLSRSARRRKSRRSVAPASPSHPRAGRGACAG